MSIFSSRNMFPLWFFKKKFLLTPPLIKLLRPPQESPIFDERETKTLLLHGKRTIVINVPIYAVLFVLSLVATIIVFTGSAFVTRLNAVIGSLAAIAPMILFGFGLVLLLKDLGTINKLLANIPNDYPPMTKGELATLLVKKRYAEAKLKEERKRKYTGN